MNAAETPAAPSAAPRFRAFISYSHAADDRLAPALQSGLQQLAKPWYRLRAMRVFRDKTGLAVTPELWGSIEKALADSDYFILLASPPAAESKWVEQEVDWWLRNHTAAHLLIVLTDGELAWDAGAGDFDWNKTTALPRRLEKAFTEEPKYLDLRSVKSSRQLSLREPRFLEAIAGLSATLQARSLDELIGEDLHQHVKTMRLLRYAVGGLAVLTVTAGVAAYLAIEARKEAGALVRARDAEAFAAQRQADSREIAERALAALGADPDLAVLLAAEAVTVHPTAEAVSALRQSLSGELPPAKAWNAHKGGAYFAEFTKDGRSVISGGADNMARLWDPVGGKLLFELRGHTNGVTGADIAPDGTRICTISTYDHTARVWDLGSGTCLFEIKQDRLDSAEISPDGKYILTSSNLDELSIWDAASGRFVRRVGEGWREISSARFSPDGGRVVVVDRDPAVCDVATGKKLFTLDGHTQQVRDVGYSPDGQWLVTASEDRTARIWRAANGKSAAVLPHEREVVFALFSPGGRWVVTGDADRVVRVWDPATRSRVAEIDVRPMTLSHFALSPTGNLLAAVLEENAAELYETRSGAKVAELTGIDGPILSVSFSPDGRRIATAGLDGKVSLYDVELGGTTEQLLALARKRVTRPLSAEERARYLPAR
jgi:WD40 repeat protein